MAKLLDRSARTVSRAEVEWLGDEGKVSSKHVGLIAYDLLPTLPVIGLITTDWEWLANHPGHALVKAPEEAAEWTFVIGSLEGWARLPKSMASLIEI